MSFLWANPTKTAILGVYLKNPALRKRFAHLSHRHRNLSSERVGGGRCRSGRRTRTPARMRRPMDPNPICSSTTASTAALTFSSPVSHSYFQSLIFNLIKNDLFNFWIWWRFPPIQNRIRSNSNRSEICEYSSEISFFFYYWCIFCDKEWIFR